MSDHAMQQGGTAMATETSLAYEIVNGWEQLPEGWTHPDVAGVATDSQDRVFLFSRGEHPIIVYDREGRFLRSWGRDVIRVAHGLRRHPNGDIWATDTDRHQIYRFTREGRLVASWGQADEPGYGDGAFNMPTDLGFGPNGITYVSDGYGNSRVVMLDDQGRFVGTWGEHGSAPGQFDTPHSLAVAPDGRVFVCDRGNFRLQVFDAQGAYLTEWRPEIGSPQGITIAGDGTCWLLCAIDSITGRVVRLDIDSLQPLVTFEGPGHMIEISPWGDVFAASLTGNIIRWRPAA
jgi:DNA-binding beta-propeller fold protein YncE